MYTTYMIPMQIFTYQTQKGHNMSECNCNCDKVKELEARIKELEAFVEKALSNPMIKGMIG